MLKPFASIHPAFLVDKSLFLDYSKKIAQNFQQKHYIGYHNIQFSYGNFSNSSNEDESNLLIGNDVSFAKFENYLPQLLVNQSTETQFDPELMSNGVDLFTYVQTEFEFPDLKDIIEIQNIFKESGISNSDQIHFHPNLNSSKLFGIVVSETSPKELIQKVFNIFCLFDDVIFPSNKYPNSKIPTYINAISFLLNQYSQFDELRSSTLSTIVSDTEVILNNNQRKMDKKQN